MDLDAIEQRTNAATQGPWKRSAEQDDTPVVYRNHPAVAGAAEVIFTADWGTEADAEFTAHARQDVPDLVARVRELEKSVRVHRESITRLDSIKSERGARIVELEEENQKLRDDLEATTSVEVWPLARVLSEVRCGSQDWSWEEEWADLDERHAPTGYLDKLDQQIQTNGITMPILLGNDGRLWDGHHRLRIAVRRGIPYVPIEVMPRRAETEFNAALTRARDIAKEEK